MGEVEERKVNAMSTKEGVMVVNCWDSAESKRMKGWTEKNESPFLKSLLCVMLEARGEIMLCERSQFVRSFECPCEFAVEPVEFVRLEKGTLAGSWPCSASSSSPESS